MNVHEIHRQIIVPGNLEEVFSFFDRPENLNHLTPPRLGFELLTPKPLPMHNGAVIDYVSSLIMSYDPPNRFVDTQIKGPYSFWHHLHQFESVDGETRITDHVHYALPYGWLGRLAHGLFVRRQLEWIFSYRADVIGRVFAEGAHLQAGKDRTTG